MTADLARAVSPAAKAATTAHLLQTLLYHEAHTARHARQLLDPAAQGDAEWQFNWDHARRHLDGALEHAGKLGEHLRDNYSAEGRWLNRLHALAKDLAADGPSLDLAEVPVRPYTRTVQTPRGSITEQVRGAERRTGGWIPQPDWLAGQREWVARGEAAWAAHRRAREHAHRLVAVYRASGPVEVRAQLAGLDDDTLAAVHDHLTREPLLRASGDAERVAGLAGQEMDSRAPAAVPADVAGLTEETRRIIAESLGKLATTARQSGWDDEARILAAAQTTWVARDDATAVNDLGKAAAAAARAGGPGADRARHYRWLASRMGPSDGEIIGEAMGQVSAMIDAAEKARWTSEALYLHRAWSALFSDQYDVAVRSLREAARWAHVSGSADGDSRAKEYRAVARKVAATGRAREGAEDLPARQAVRRVLVPGAEALTRIFGRGEIWDRKMPDLFDAEHPPQGMPGELAELSWGGHMKMLDQVARDIQAAEAGGAVQNPRDFTVPLHELIHGIIPDGSTPSNQRAYQDYPAAVIEEGFTELATIQHAPEFFDAIGVGDRPTAMTAVGAPDNPAYTRQRDALLADLQAAEDRLRRNANLWNTANEVREARWDLEEGDLQGALEAIAVMQHTGRREDYDAAIAMEAKLQALLDTPLTLPATMDEYARRIQDPARVMAGDAWGHYPDQTRAAQQWVELVAAEEGRADAGRPGTPGWLRTVQLADEVNRQGAAGKIWAMAYQAARAFDPALSPDRLAALAENGGALYEAIWQAWANPDDRSPAVTAWLAARTYLRWVAQMDKYAGHPPARGKAA